MKINGAKKYEIIYKIVVNTLKENELREFNRLYNRFFTFLNLNRNYIDESKLSEWQNFLDNLDELNSSGKILALKIVTAILYQEERSHYYNEEIIDALLERFKRYFSSEVVDRREKIEFAVAYQTSQPKEHLWKYSDYRLTTSLEALFIEEAKEEPLYILEQFDKIENPDRDYFFYFLDDTPKNFLEFAHLVQKYRPLLYLKALVNFVDYANDTRDKKVDKSEFNKASKALYEKIAQEDYSSEFRVENALQKLIQYSYMDTDWYEELFVLLWNIESKKEEQDENSRLNCLQIGINSKNEKLLVEVYERFDEWRNSYQFFDFESVEPFILHFREINKLFEEALYDDTLCHARNFSLSNTIERKIIDDFIDTCYNMLAWLYRDNKKYYFRLLVNYLEVDNISNKPISKRVDLANEALSRFSDEFEEFATNNIADAVEILGMLLNKSNSGWYPTEFINRTLDKVYFIIEDIASIRAKNELDRAILKETEHYEKYDRGGPCPWRPRYASETKYATAELLERLSRSDDEETRENVAENPNTSSKLLAFMSKDSLEGVRVRVARNPNTSIETLCELVEDKKHLVVSGVCENPNMDEDFLYKMSKGDNASHVAINPHIPLKCIDLLYTNESEYVRARIAKHVNTPKKILEKLAKDRDSYVREAVASNPNTPKHLLEKLNRDEENYQIKIKKQTSRREKMSLTPEIKDAFNKFFMIFMALATIGILVKSIPFTLHHMSKIMLISTLSTAYFFASKYKRTLVKKEYIQMILFGILVQLGTTLFLFYKTEGVGFLKIIGNLLLHFDVSVVLATLLIIVAPALMLALFFSKFFLGKVLKGKDGN